MRFTVITLFPEMFKSTLNASILKRAQDSKRITLDLINLRNFASDSYGTVDDRPYGGGTGMLLKVDVIDRALESIINTSPSPKKLKTVLLDPAGQRYSQKLAQSFACDLDHLIFVCGHYEGVDARARQLVNEVISIGDYIVTGGELPAMVIIDSITRLIPGVINPEANIDESFVSARLEAPQYTRPATYKNMKVPEVLLSGDHAAIKAWREKHKIKNRQV